MKTQKPGISTRWLDLAVMALCFSADNSFIEILIAMKSGATREDIEGVINKIEVAGCAR